MEVPNTTLKSKHTSKERIIQGTLEKYVLGEKERRFAINTIFCDLKKDVYL